MFKTEGQEEAQQMKVERARLHRELEMQAHQITYAEKAKEQANSARIYLREQLNKVTDDAGASARQ